MNNTDNQSYRVNEYDIKSKNTKDAIYFNFSYSALKLLGKNLYSTPANAISELVANALDARAPRVYVYIDMSDKAHSVIEILDNGSGMSYDDLADKYVWIGRNKRNDTSLSNEEKQTVMGRKGIGKLAALYLSNQYYIITKQENDAVATQWEVNLKSYDDSEFPRLDRVARSIELVNQTIWDTFHKGTVIKLENVDLRGNGEKKIESLRRVFADFYLIDSLSSIIYVAVKTEPNQSIEYKRVEKKIAYKNFYALYDNSSFDIASKMQKSIAFTWSSNYPHIANKPRNTVFLDGNTFKYCGTKEFKKEDGTAVTKDYCMSGWIAIHCTIEQSSAVDSNFIRNNVYQPNHLRLYVRNKLAVENYFTLRHNTQAMANYIEGEISFDILDDDDLPDIATSSRQDFLADERIDLLSSIVDPILSTLFKLRNKVGHEISEEDEAYTRFLIEEEEKKRKAEADARAKAEEETEKAKRAQKEAEVKYEEAKYEAKKYRAQSQIVFSTVTEDQKNFATKTHLVKTNALAIRNSVKTLAKKIGIDKYREVSSISIATDKILSAINYSAIANFNIEDEYITEDLFLYCEEYLMNVLSHQYFDIDMEVQKQTEYRVRFNPQYMSLVLDNLLSNTRKSNSSKVAVNMYFDDQNAIIEYSDNGNGFEGVDLKQIFEFGISNTGGTGIGLYNINTVVHKMNGKIEAMENNPCGAKFVISLPR